MTGQSRWWSPGWGRRSRGPAKPPTRAGSSANDTPGAGVLLAFTLVAVALVVVGFQTMMSADDALPPLERRSDHTITVLSSSPIHEPELFLTLRSRATTELEPGIPRLKLSVCVREPEHDAPGAAAFTGLRIVNRGRPIALERAYSPPDADDGVMLVLEEHVGFDLVQHFDLPARELEFGCHLMQVVVDDLDHASSLTMSRWRLPLVVANRQDGSAYTLTSDEWDHLGHRSPSRNTDIDDRTWWTSHEWRTVHYSVELASGERLRWSNAPETTLEVDSYELVTGTAGGLLHHWGHLDRNALELEVEDVNRQSERSRRAVGGSLLLAIGSGLLLDLLFHWTRRLGR